MKRILIAIVGIFALAMWGIPVASAQTHSYGTNNLKLCITASAVVTVVNPLQPCPLGQPGYKIVVSAVNDPPEVVMTAKINVDGTIATQSVVTDASNNTTNWISSSSLANNNYTITFAPNFFISTPICTEHFTTAPPPNNVFDSIDFESAGTLVYIPVVNSNGFIQTFNSAADIQCWGRSSKP